MLAIHSGAQLFLKATHFRCCMHKHPNAQACEIRDVDVVQAAFKVSVKLVYFGSLPSIRNTHCLEPWASLAPNHQNKTEDDAVPTRKLSVINLFSYRV